MRTCDARDCGAFGSTHGPFPVRFPKTPLVGSLPLVVLYSFFVEHYVSSMTGAVKE